MNPDDAPPPATSPEPEAVLAFWYHPETQKRWFFSNAEFDAAVAERLAPLHALAAAGRLDAWAETPRGALALIILLDQVPRNLFRGEARAFASDPKALACAKAACARGFARALEVPEKLFLYMPFQHSESLASQEESLRLFAELTPPAAEGDEQGGAGAGGDSEDYARKHWDIIRRFGRFPHRNRALGRETTAAEEKFLQEENLRFGQ